jgi:hypothetical protein
MAAIPAPRQRLPVALSLSALVSAFGGVLRRWRYTGGKRDLRFDLLRGLAVVAMVVDHVGGDQSWLYTITGGNRFLVSAAEAFVFISGLVMGIVYSSVVTRQGVAAALSKALKRSWTLYMLTVGLTLVTAMLAYQLKLFWAPQVTTGTLPNFIVGVLTLHRTFYLTDVLLMYTFLVAGAALALLLIAQGYTWQALAASWLIWGIWQRWPQEIALPWAIADNNVFQLAAWQLLFINGLAIGYHRRALARYFGWLTGWVSLAVSGALFAGAIALYRDKLATLSWLTGFDTNFLNAHLFSKDDARIGRLVVFAILAVFALALTTNFWGPLHRVFGWLLLPLGQNALWAYSLHLFVIMATTKLGPVVFGNGAFTSGQNALLQAAGVLAIWLYITLRAPIAARVRQLAPRPAPVAVVAARRVEVEGQ